VLNINGVYGCINKAYILKVYLQSFIYLRETITTSKVLHGFGRAGYFFKLYIHLKSTKHLANDCLAVLKRDLIPHNNYPLIEPEIMPIKNYLNLLIHLKFIEPLPNNKY